MRVRLYIDIESGEVRRDLGAAALTGIVFFQGNRVPLELVFMRGDEEVTSDILTGGAVLQVGLRSARPGVGVLALADFYSLDGEVASTILSLATVAIVDELATVPADWREVEAWFEVVVTSADETTRQTFAQLAARVRREAINEEDYPEIDPMLYVLKSSLLDSNGRARASQFPGVRTDITSAALHRAVVTAGAAVPWLIITLEGGLLTPWILRQREAGEDDDTNTYRVPNDWHATTNNRVWMRTSFA